MTDSERLEIAEILRLEANEVAHYRDTHRDSLPPIVSMALCREMARLRSLAEKLNLAA